MKEMTVVVIALTTALFHCHGHLCCYCFCNFYITLFIVNGTQKKDILRSNQLTN